MVDFFTCSVGVMAVDTSVGEPGIVAVGRAEVTRRAFALRLGTKASLGASPPLYSPDCGTFRKEGGGAWVGGSRQPAKLAEKNSEARERVAAFSQSDNSSFEPWLSRQSSAET